MPISDYVKVTIGDMEAEVTSAEELPLSITYGLEDPDNFPQKKSATALGLTIPATLVNQRTANNFSNPDVKDLTTGEAFKGNQPCTIDAGGYEILNGKAFLKNATHTDKPQQYKFDLYGDNAGWQIDLEESTLYDFLKHITFVISKQLMVDSWIYDGTNEALPYVFAPVKYRQPFGGYKVVNGLTIPVNDNVEVTYLKPSISVYFILYWAFKSLGYRIQSNFFDTPFFRRQVMPWTFGNFLNSDGTKLDIHKFLAKSSADFYFSVGSGDQGQDVFVNLNVLDTLPGTFDNNGNPGDYTYDATAFEMVWTYNQQDFGFLHAGFSMQLYYNYRIGGNNSQIAVRVYWYKTEAITGIKTQLQVDTIFDETGPLVNTSTNAGAGIKDVFLTNAQVRIGDKISAKVKRYMYRSKQLSNEATLTLNIYEFKLDYFRIPVGGTISLANYTALQKYKVLDFMRGKVDEFNLSLNTDSINKVVYIEPTHAYSLTNNLAAPANTGYFKDDFVTWDGKEDLSKEWEMENYSDYEREVTFRYKEDTNDGILKKLQDRNVTTLAAAKYVFPSRFKTGKKEVPNRFFGPTMHYDVNDFKPLAAMAPQMVVIVPENVSNTSSSEADNTFTPKSCYYKGLVTGVGKWKFDGEVKNDYPFMFAVNYKPGGENDPILSYSDELIGDHGDLQLTNIAFQVGGGFINFFNQNTLFSKFYAGQQITLSNTVSNNGTYTIQSATVISPTQFAVSVLPLLTTEMVVAGSINSTGNTVIGKGLLKRFYWQRLAIMRNGQWYNTWFRLKNSDVAGQLHREYKSYGGHLWQLIQMKGYKPLRDESTACLLYKHAPIEQKDLDNTFPSAAAIKDTGTPSGDPFDVKYSPLKALYTDIPS